MTGTKQNLQDVFLGHLLKHKTPTTVFLTNGVKLQGIVTGFDTFSMLLRREAHAQLIYKHAISTIMPNVPVSMGLGETMIEEPETNPV
jgi:host factor-I protein